MNKEKQATIYYRDIIGLLSLIIVILLFTNLVIANFLEIPNPQLRWTVLVLAIIISIVLNFIGRFIFPHRRLIKKAMKPGVDSDKRIQLLKKSIDFEPTVEAYKKIAEVKMLKYGKENQLSGIEYCDKILDIDPNDYEAYIMKSHFYDELNQKENAMKWVSKSIEMHPDHNKASNYSRYKVRGTWRLDNGNFQAAKEDFLKSIEQKEPNRNVLFYLGLAEEKIGNHDFALLNYDQYLRKNVGTDDIKERALIRISNIYFERGKAEKAKEYWSKLGSISEFNKADDEIEMVIKLRENLKTG